ncbi:MAG: YaeQ family protein, partial [Betaproteobacteria bacterium]
KKEGGGKGRENKLSRLDKLQVFRVPTEVSQQLAAMAARSMHVQATVQDGAVTLSGGSEAVVIEALRWK